MIQHIGHNRVCQYILRSDFLWTPLTAEYRCRERQESQALSELEETFSPEQKDLFLFYEAARNATSDAYVDWVARKAFLLAREIYR